MFEFLPLLLAEETPLVGRIVGGLIAIALGVFMIAVGMKNVNERKSEETGARRLVNSALGQNNSYEGGKAVVQGYARIIGGVLLLFGGVIFMIYGAVLAP